VKGVIDTRDGKRVHVDVTTVPQKFAGDIENKYIERISQQEKMRWVPVVVNYLMHDLVAI
jgi:hypothetical protein